jgi:hypothetical protein
MSQQQPEAITCPSCGNINVYTADECLKCGLGLGPIRVAMAEAGTPGAAMITSAPAKPKEPAPPLPELPPRPTTEKVGDYVDSWCFLIRGMGDRAQEIAARFFKQLADRGIEGLKLNVGELIIDVGGGKLDSRDYYFVERDLGEGAVATMAVRIAPTGTDLFVEWRHYVLPPIGGDIDWVVFAILFIFTVPAFVYLWWVKNKARASSLKGFQGQDSTAFQLAVRAALDEAIDLAGISKALIQQLPKEEEKERRVI